MDSYTFALLLGGAGLVAMAASGVAHSGGHPNATGGRPGLGDAGHGSGHGPGHSGHSGHSAGHDTAGHVGARPGNHVGESIASGVGLRQATRMPGATLGGVKSTLLALASPRGLFSLLVGFGLTGIAARHLLGGPFLLALAILGAIVFEALLVGPLWKLLFRFASNPATSLEGSLLTEAHATSGFDANGQGLVALEVDGQMVQCLGTLRADDRALGVHVHSGDRLRVEEVDAARNRCTVSYVGRSLNSSH